MKSNYAAKVPLGYLLCLLTFLFGCCISIGGCDREEYERTERLSASMSKGGTFAAQTHSGSITINGADVADCNLTATITARAATKEEAKKLAEGVKIKLKPVGDSLIAEIQKPAFMQNKSVCVSFNVTLPGHSNLELATHNGRVTVANISGSTDATTHNGRVTASQVAGTTTIRTHNDSIGCEQVSGDVTLRTHNGHVKAVYCESAPPVCNVSIVSHNGGIDFTAPPNLSAEVDVSTHNGSINTDSPMVITGEIGRGKSLKGTIGEGNGKLHIETHNGSVSIK